MMASKALHRHCMPALTGCCGYPRCQQWWMTTHQTGHVTDCQVCIQEYRSDWDAEQ